MTIGDFAGLVELPEAAEPVKRPSPSELPKAKRTQLRRYDHFACQVNNHLGVSMIKDAAPSDVWPAMCNGNHSVAYFHEFCSSDPAQRGVGWSKFGELFTALAEPLSSQAMQCTELLNCRLTVWMGQCRDSARSHLVAVVLVQLGYGCAIQYSVLRLAITLISH